MQECFDLLGDPTTFAVTLLHIFFSAAKIKQRFKNWALFASLRSQAKSQIPICCKCLISSLNSQFLGQNVWFMFFLFLMFVSFSLKFPPLSLREHEISPNSFQRKYDHSGEVEKEYTYGLFLHFFLAVFESPCCSPCFKDLFFRGIPLPLWIGKENFPRMRIFKVV